MLFLGVKNLVRLLRCPDDIDEAVGLIQQCHLRRLALLGRG